MNYKHLNLIKNIVVFPFVVFWRLLLFIAMPLIFILGIFITDWEDESQREFIKEELKKYISFGFWK